MSTTRPMTTLIAAAALALAGGMLGCRGDRSEKRPRQFFPDMDDAPKWTPQSKSGFYADGRTMRPPPAGTVAFSRVPMGAEMVGDAAWGEAFRRQRADLLKDDAAAYQGKDAKGDWLESIPVPVTESVILHGQKKFGIYCAACHGYTGDGKGMVGQQWAYPLPTFHDPKYSDPKQYQGRDGYIFHVSRYGVTDAAGANKMPGYGHALTESDAWAVVAYIRTLQETRRGKFDDVRDAEARQILDRTRPPRNPAPTTGGKP